MTSNMVLIRIRYAPSPKGLRHGQRGGPARPGPSGLPTRRQGRALEPSRGHDLPTGESPSAPAPRPGKRTEPERPRPRPMPCALRLPMPWVRGPVSHAVPTVLSHCARRRRAPRGCRLRPPTVGYGRETELAQPLAPFEFSFEPFACGKDRNRLSARATRCRTPKGSACSRTLRRPALSLDQTVQKKKFQGPVHTQGDTS